MEADEAEYPIYNEGTVLHSANPRDFTCYICLDTQNDLLVAHLKNEDHILRLKNYGQYFSNKGPLVYCRLCPSPIDFSEVINHAEDHKLIPWYVPDESSEILLKNFISERKHQYFCHLCNMKLPFWFLVEPHNRDSNHQALKRNMTDEAILGKLSFSSAYYKLVTNHCIFIKTPNSLLCFLCDSPVEMSYESILSHIQKKSHLKKNKAHLEAVKSAETYRLPSRLCPDSKISDHEVQATCDPILDENNVTLTVSFPTICDNEIDTENIESHLLSHANEQDPKNPDCLHRNLSNHRIEDLRLNNECQFRKNDLIMLNGDEDKSTVRGCLEQVRILCECSDTLKCKEAISNSNEGSCHSLPSEDEIYNETNLEKLTDSKMNVLNGYVNENIAQPAQSCVNPSTSVCNKPISPHNDIHSDQSSPIHGRTMRLIAKFEALDFSSKKSRPDRRAILKCEKGKKLICTICSCTVEPEDVDDHVTNSTHLANGQNVISRIGQSAYNYQICHCDLGDKNLLQHLRNSVHQMNKASLASDRNISDEVKKLSSLSLADLPNGIEEVFTNSNKPFLMCTICNCRIPSPEAVDEHVATYHHVAKGPNVILRIDAYNFKCEVCNCTIQEQSRLKDHLNRPDHLKNKTHMRSSHCAIPGKSLPLSSELRSCLNSTENSDQTTAIAPANTHEQNVSLLSLEKSNTDVTSITNSHSLEINKNIKGISKDADSAASDDLPQGIERITYSPKESHLLCTICNFIGDISNLAEHVASLDHRTNAVNVIVQMGPDNFRCEICKCDIASPRDRKRHLKTHVHLEKIFPKHNNALAPLGIVQREDGSFWCDLCSVNLGVHSRKARTHQYTARHKMRYLEKANATLINHETKTTNQILPGVSQLPNEGCHVSEEEAKCSSSDRASEPAEDLKEVSSQGKSTNGVSQNITCYESERPDPSQIPKVLDDLVDSSASSPSNRLSSPFTHASEKKSNEICTTKSDSSTVDNGTKLHSKLENPSAADNLPEGIERFFTSKEEPLLLCTICNCKVLATTVTEHVASLDHRANGPKLIVRVNADDFKCEICNCTIQHYSNVMRHLKDSGHLRNSTRKTLSDSATTPEVDTLTYKINRQNKDSRSIRAKDIDENVQGLSQMKQISDSANSVKKHTPAPRLISNFQLINSEDPVRSSSVEPEDPKKVNRQATEPIQCEICKCVIPGGYWNINIHKSSKEHLENESKMLKSLEKSHKNKDTVSGPRQATRKSSLKDIPADKIVQHHYKDDGTIDSIECKVCDLKIRETKQTPVILEYLNHTTSEEHKINENIFIESWQTVSHPHSAATSKTTNRSNQAKRNNFDSRTTKTRIPCLICGVMFSEQRDVHSHMTEHLWKQFRDAQLSPENSPKKAIEKNSSADDTKDIKFGVDKWFEQDKASKHPSNFINRPLDIELNDEEDIYKVDDCRKEDIMVGVLLSFTIDEKTMYCLVCRKSIQNSVQNCYEHWSSAVHLDYLEDMIDDHRMFIDYPEQFSDLSLAYEYMQEVSDCDVQCYACGISIVNDPLKLMEHINEQLHAEKRSNLGSKAKAVFDAVKSRMTSDFYSTQTYWCVPCKARFAVETEFRKHLYKQKHAKTIRRFENEILIFDSCTVCATLWFGFIKTFSYHSTCQKHKYQALDKIENFYLVTKLPPLVKKFLHKAEYKIEEIITKVDSLNSYNRKKERKLIRDLENICKGQYPHIKAYPFGSRVAGLAIETSDFDIFLDCNPKDMPESLEQDSDDRQILVRLQNIKKCLEKHPEKWCIDSVIKNCNVPIIKVTHKSSDIECDISFTEALGVERAKVLKAYCVKYPPCRKLIIFLKHWMGLCGLTGIDGVPSHGIALMVVYFLQVASIVPTISDLMRKTKKSLKFRGWETAFNPDFQPHPTDKGFTELLTELFKFYATFDYRNDVICPLLGEPMKKKQFRRPSDLPSAMNAYFDYINGVNHVEPFRIDSILCVQDPFDLAINITKAVKKVRVHRLKTFCMLSAQLLGDDA